jgi:hypothetical protein
MVMMDIIHNYCYNVITTKLYCLFEEVNHEHMMDIIHNYITTKLYSNGFL